VVTTFVYTHKDWDDYSRWVNVIFSTTDIHANEWSDPVYFDFPGYDTSISWGDDGKAYMVGSFYWRVRVPARAHRLRAECSFRRYGRRFSYSRSISRRASRSRGNPVHCERRCSAWRRHAAYNGIGGRVWAAWPRRHPTFTTDTGSIIS
jgi:hypothetical protein